MVDKAIIVKNSIKEMEKNCKRKMPFQGFLEDGRRGLAYLSQGLYSET
jgi:hypothetical protein